MKYSNALHYTIAYKGGHYERDALLVAGCKYMANLEDYGCPKFETLLRNPEFVRLGSEFIDKKSVCMRHQRIRKGTAHCPQYEVQIFGAWLILESPSLLSYLPSWSFFFMDSDVEEVPDYSISDPYFYIAYSYLSICILSF